MPRIALLFLLIVAGLIGWLVYEQSREPPFIVSGFVEADEIRVGSRIGGRVASVKVEEGQSVKTGETIFDLDPFNLNEQLAVARAQSAAARAECDRLKAGFRAEEIEQARARKDLAAATLEQLVAGPRSQEIAMAREQLKIAQASYELAESEYQRISGLRENQQAAQTEFDNALRTRKAATAEVARAEQALALLEEGTRKEEIAAARARLAEAEQALKLVEAGNRVEDIARAQAQLTAAEAQVASIEVQLAELIVKSPCDCLVEAVDLRPGDLVAANAPSAALLDLSRLWLRAYIPESRLGTVKLGRKVAIRVAGFGDRRFTGRVSFVSHDAEFTPRNIQTPEERSKQVFRIKVVIDEGRNDLRVGMSADLLFDEEPPK